MSFYRTGAIALTNGSAAVTGTGTDFINGAAVGECVQAPDGNLYEILSIQSATALTLGQVYLGATASGQAYSIIPTQSYIRDLASQAATLVNNYSATNTTALKTSDADKTTPVDADKLAMRDSVSGTGRLLPWSNLKTSLKTYFDSATQTLSNKTISAVNNTLSGIAASSFVVSNASGNIAGAVAQKAIPAGVVVGTTDTQTLTNKTINLTSNTLVATSAQIQAAVTGETGSGALVFGTSPTLTTPTLTTEALVVTTNNYPFIRPSLNLDFANSQAVDPRITFTRASTATRTNRKGLIEIIPANVPRIDYDPVTLECKGLLIEEARTNLLTYSEQFDNVGWNKSLAIITPNTNTAPDGTLTADTVTLTGHSGGIYMTAAVTPSTVYTGSVFIAAGTVLPSAIQFAFYDATNLAFITFDIYPTLVGTVGGFDRYAYSITTPAGCTSLRFYPSRTSAISSGTVVMWGAQLEAGSFPTSYIPTVATQVTRAADVASMTGANFSSWYRQDEGSFVSNVTYTNGVSILSKVALGVSDGTFNNSIYHSMAANSMNVSFSMLFGGAIQANAAAFATTQNTPLSVSFAYANNNLSTSYNGGTALTDLIATVPTGQNTLALGSAPWSPGSSSMCGYIQRLTYYPKRLTNDQLQALSTQ